MAIITIPIIFLGILLLNESEIILPRIAKLEWLENLIASSPRAATYYLAFVLPLVLVTVGIAAFAGARAIKKATKKEFRIVPSSTFRSDLRPETPARKDSQEIRSEDFTS